MTALPKPPVPAECSMRGNDWFPLYFNRLRKSKWWRRASDTARARNVMLWGEAYQATPAGSLPDDDDELAEAAGYGMDVEAFLAVKAEIMAPWTLHSDGRWYHPIVCEVVLEAWSKASERRKRDAQRKADSRARSLGVRDETDDVRADIADVTAENDTQERQERKDRKEIQEANASLSPEGDESEELPKDFLDAWKAYPHAKGRSSRKKAFGAWRRIPLARRSLLPAAIARYARDGREPKQDCGAPKMERWLADELYLDWMTDAPPPAQPQGPAWPGPPEIRDAVLALNDGKRLAVGYLDRCLWQEVPTRAVLCPFGTVADELRKQAGPTIAGFGAAILHRPEQRGAA